MTVRNPTKPIIGALWAAVFTISVALAGSSALLAKDGNVDSNYTAFGKYVDAKGNFTFPKNFASEWVHMGTWAVVEENAANDLHIVYAPKEVIAYYRKHKKFADGAIMVKEVRNARGSHHTTGSAFWATDVKVWFVMVRDTKGRFPENALWGEGWGWALYKGGDQDTQVATDYKKDCLGCHVPAKDTDWVYLYAYPILGDDVAKFAPPAPKLAQASAPAKPAKTEGVNAAMPDEMLVAEGSKVFRRCKSCHTRLEGKHRVGPSLFGVFDRQSGTAAGYNRFSEAMKNAKVTWNAENLDKFLKKPSGDFIKGNKMGRLFRKGVPDDQNRKAVIEYLRFSTK